MTFRASYFTVRPLTYRPWDPAQPNYLVTVLQPVAAAPPHPLSFDHPPPPLSPPADFLFPNLALLNFAQLQVHPVGATLDETVPRPPPRPIDFQFRNVALLNFAQLQVFPVGKTLDETVPLPWRPRDFLAPNLLTIQPTAKPFANQQFDRPQSAARQPAFPAPNLLTGTLLVTYSPATAVWDPDPQPLPRRPDFQAPNLVVRAVAVAVPFSPELSSDRPQPSRQADFQFPNLVIALRPVAGLTVDRPAVQPRPLDFLPRNLLTSQPVAAAAPFVNRFFEQPAPQVRVQDFIAPNIALAPTVFVFRAPLIAYPAPVVHPIDGPLPNLAVLTPAVVKPAAQRLFDDRPLPPKAPQDFAFPNVALAPTIFVFRAPLIAYPAPVVHPVDMPLPNLAVLTPAVVQVPFANQFDDRPVAVSLPVDGPIPNLLTTTLTVVAKPVSNPIFERPLLGPKAQDFQTPNLVVTTPAAVKPAAQRLFDDRPLPPKAPQDFAFPNVALTPTLFVFRAPLISQPIATRLPVDAPVPNLLTTTLSVAAVKPPSNLTGIERPLPMAARQDFQFPNLLTNTLFTPPGTPFTANPSLFNDRPAAKTLPWDLPPANFLPFRPPPTPSVELHQNPFFITMGRLSQLGNLPS